MGKVWVVGGLPSQVNLQLSHLMLSSQVTTADKKKTQKREAKRKQEKITRKKWERKTRRNRDQKLQKCGESGTTKHGHAAHAKTRWHVQR